MSVTDPSAEPVQPEGEGQGGGEATGGSPWESYLTRFPEEVRDDAASAFREMEANATKRFQEHADYRKQWEPYESLGLNQRSAEDVAWDLQVAQAARENPQALREWLDAQYGPVDPQQPVQPAPDEFAFQDPNAQFEQLLKQHLTPLQQKLETYDQRWAQQEEQAAIAAGQQVIDQQINALKKEHGTEFTSRVEQLVLSRAQSEYLNDPQNAISRAWGDVQALMNEISKQTLQSKVDAPSPAETGGVPDVTPETFSRIDAPGLKEQALEFLRTGNRM